MTDNFFTEEPMDEQEQVVEKIKVGEVEYTQEELDKYIGLGKLGVELEEKWNTKLDRVVPEYTKATQRIKDLEDYKSTVEKLAPKEEEKLTDKEQVLAEAKSQLKSLGYLPADEVEKRSREIANEVFAGYKLVEKVDTVLSKQVELGYPQVNREDLLEFMNEKNLVDPELAYKIKFEREIDAVKEKKLASIKPSTFVTERTSSAGGKQPAPVKITKANLGDVIESYL